MKQTSIALALGALLAAAGAAQAADIQMYGRVDSGLRYTHTKDTGDDKLEMRNNRSTPRVGFNIVEDLGNGVKVKAYLENGFYLDTGSLYTANTLFDRRSILAVQGAWGEIGMGRMGNVQSTVSPYAMASSSTIRSAPPTVRRPSAPPLPTQAAPTTPLHGFRQNSTAGR